MSSEPTERSEGYSEDRRRRQAQDVSKAKLEGKYRGRPENADRNTGIAGMLRSGMSWWQFTWRWDAAGPLSPRSLSGPRKRPIVPTSGHRLYRPFCLRAVIAVRVRREALCLT
jgi:hypothetical protein